MAVFYFFGAILLILIVSALMPQYSKSTRAEVARAYVDWLELNWPELPVKTAAANRIMVLQAKSFEISAKDRREMREARWVMEGWHLWTGAVV